MTSIGMEGCLAQRWIKRKRDDAVRHRSSASAILEQMEIAINILVCALDTVWRCRQPPGPGLDVQKKYDRAQKDYHTLLCNTSIWTLFRSLSLYRTTTIQVGELGYIMLSFQIASRGQIQSMGEINKFVI